MDRGPLQDLEGLTSVTIREAIDQGLHEHLDHIQIALQSLANALAAVYFDDEEAVEEQTQSQAMG